MNKAAKTIEGREATLIRGADGALYTVSADTRESLQTDRAEISDLRGALALVSFHLDHASARQVIEPGDHASARQVIEPGDHASARQVIEPGDHASARQVIEPGDHASARQVIEPGDRVTA